MGFLFGGGSGGNQRPAPIVKMPDTADPVLKAAADRKKRSEQGRGGRQSTIMSRGQPGTAAYANTALGQAV